MDLHELWNIPGGDERAEQNPERAELEAMLGQQSRGILAQLRKKLLYKIFWGLGIGLVDLILLLLNPHNAAFWLMSALLIPMVIILGTKLFRFYQQLPNRLDMSREILPVMKEYDEIVRNALRYEERIGTWFVIPSPAVGAMIGMMEHEMTLVDIFTDWKRWIVILVVMLVFSPLAMYMAKWMNRIAFGKYLKQLEANIQALEELEEE